VLSFNDSIKSRVTNRVRLDQPFLAALESETAGHEPTFAPPQRLLPGVICVCKTVGDRCLLSPARGVYHVCLKSGPVSSAIQLQVGLVPLYILQ
jgi:hypothetical protein